MKQLLLLLLICVGCISCSPYTYNIGCNNFWGTTFEQRIERQGNVCIFYIGKIDKIQVKENRDIADTLHLILLHLEYRDEKKIFDNMIEIYQDILNSGDTTPLNHLSFTNFKK